MTTAEAPTAEDALAAIEKAWDTVSALCSGKMRWEMRVPAEPDRDPDLVIGEALRLAKAYIEACPEHRIVAGPRTDPVTPDYGWLADT